MLTVTLLVKHPSPSFMHSAQMRQLETPRWGGDGGDLISYSWHVRALAFDRPSGRPSRPPSVRPRTRLICDSFALRCAIARSNRKHTECQPSDRPTDRPSTVLSGKAVTQTQQIKEVGSEWRMWSGNYWTRFILCTLYRINRSRCVCVK